ncbi:FAD-dependent oxidoreductase [Gordonia sp. NPDC003585]|uniref:NAD(P)/FAD-dependent oxidoreductase n=1 Tax=unclassified Gordonia (in: high G+C Gram-positive bacteria) TaxID=2657482 RepID=UPI0033A43AEA
MTTVVVGAGLGGLRAGQRIRELSGDEVVIVGDEAYRPYNRPPVSKELLAGTMSAEECIFPDADDGFRWELGNPAVGLDLEHNEVALRHDSIAFDRLVIATGRRARLPSNIPDLQGIHVLRGIDDARRFGKAVSSTSNVVIMGGGFIGCEVAAVLRAAGVGSVTIVEMSETVMPVLGPTIGAFAQRVHGRHGVDVRCRTGVVAIHGATCVEEIELSTGERLAADVVLVAIGSQPNTEWLTGSGVDLDGGNVVCDEFCFAANRPDVVAVGDVAQWTHVGVGGVIRVEHWSNAADMGLHAAENLVNPSSAKPYAPIPTFWSDQYDLHIKAAGFLGRVVEFQPVETAPGKYSWDGLDSSGDLIAGVTVNDNKSFIGYRRRVAAGLTVEA